MREFHAFRVQERARLARWILFGAFVLLAAAFFRTQVLQYDRYRLRAQNNRLRPVPLQPARGTIYDRHGRVIAETVPGYSVALLASSVDSLRRVLERFRRIVPLDSADLEAVVNRYLQARYQPALVLGNATREQVARLEERRVALPGLVIQTEPRRIYPAGRAVAHLVGYVDEVSQQDLDANRYPGARVGSLVGRLGLERRYDDTLRGTPGVRYIEVDALGRLVREQGAAPPLPSVPGRSLRTEIDLPLQLYIDSIWPKGQSGAMIAMTPKGEIRALYSTPAYDPNAFIGGIAASEWRRLTNDPTLPLLNRAIQVRYPPGSPFKLATAAMALRRGLVGFDSHMPIPCRGGMQFGNRYFRCWKKEGHGSLDLTGAIEKSCDVYFYQLGLRLQLNPLLQDGVSMGFHDRSGVDLVNEVSPIYPTSTAYYDERYGPRGWSAAAVLNLAIGQGENTQTLINMMKFYAALAGDGVTPVPHIVQADSAPVFELGLEAEQLYGLRHALIQVVERGTAARSRLKEFSVAGKTGTAQNPHGKDHGWFIGFAPAESPEIVIGAIFEFGGHGSEVAPYVVQAMRRYLLGSDSTAQGPIVVRTVEDTAPRDVALPPSQGGLADSTGGGPRQP
ncbi:MAG TPA: penicillin-binding protein 2 [Gemmatimonadales bacterium]|jgi:penicillin-binding protein 2|nr:penicillin-binding protein 2 [Gemmatimonadales bacterium]